MRDRVAHGAPRHHVPALLAPLRPVLQAVQAMLGELSRTGKEEKLKGFEMIRTLVLEPHEFSVEEDLMTPSMKPKRPQLQRKYQAQIDSMYAKLKERAA